MPCFGEDAPTATETFLDVFSPETRERMMALQARNDLLTRMLCGLLTDMEKAGALVQHNLKSKNPAYVITLIDRNGDDAQTALDSDLATWWTAHKRADEERKEAEVRAKRAAVKAAWDKLTDEDLELMDLTRPELRD